MTHFRSILVAIILIITLSLLLVPAMAQDGPPAGCTYVEKDGGFETGEAWEFAETSAPGFFDAAIAHSGKQSAFVGIAATAENQEVDTTIWQEMQLPAAETITLTAWMRSQAGDENDKRYVVIWDLEADESTVLLYEPALEQDWQESTLDLTAFAGKNILLVFGVHNDGAGEKAGMWVDDVHVTACGGDISIPPTATATPTQAPPTSTPTKSPPTATPGQPEPLTPPTATPLPPTPAFEPTRPPTATPTLKPEKTQTAVSTPKLPPPPTPEPPKRPEKGLPDNNALPLLAAIILSGIIAIAAITIKLR